MTGKADAVNFMYRFKYVIALALVAVLVTAQASSAFSISSSNVATYNKWTTVDSAAYTVFTDGTTTYAKNGATGAIDNSGTNSASVIQYALDHLTPGRTNKETVAVRGAFTLSTTLTVSSLTILDLRNSELTLSNGADVTMIDTTLAAGLIDIVGGELDGNKANQSPPGEIYGIRLNAASQSTITGTYVHDADYDGIIVASGSNNRVENVLVESNGHNGVTFWSTNNTVNRLFTGVNITAKNNVMEGVGIGTANGVVLSGINTQGNGRGVSVDEGREDVITGHKSTADGYGAFLAGRGVIYTGFYVNASTTEGIIVKQETSGLDPDRVKIGPGEVRGSAGSGIELQSVIDVDLLNVNSIQNAVHGVSITGSDGKANVTISGGRFVNNTGSGVRIGSTSSVFKSVYINNIVSTDNGSFGVFVGNTVTLTNLRLLDSDLTGNTGGTYGTSSATITNRVLRGYLGLVTYNFGTNTFNGNGAIKTFTFNHGLFSTPNYVMFTAKTADASGDAIWSATTSQISVTFNTAPPSGTNNVIINWYAAFQ